MYKTKLKKKESESQGPRHARASFCTKSLPRFRARDMFDFSCTSSCYFYLSAESRVAYWRTLVALKSANFNQVLSR